MRRDRVPRRFGVRRRSVRMAPGLIAITLTTHSWPHPFDEGTMTRHAILAMLTGALLAAAALAAAPSARAADKRAFTIEDLYRLREVESPRVSPDGRTITYVVRTRDLSKGKRTARVCA